jgi:hypothetical protein
MIGSGRSILHPCGARFSVLARGRPADKGAQIAATIENCIAQRQTRHFKLSE